jgi:hypothetical protein
VKDAIDSEGLNNIEGAQIKSNKSELPHRLHNILEYHHYVPFLLMVASSALRYSPGPDINANFLKNDKDRRKPSEC